MPSTQNFFPSMILLKASNTTLSDQFLNIDCQSIVSDFFSMTDQSLSMLMKIRMVPVSVCFWYKPHVTFFPESTLTFNSKKDKLPSLSSSSMVNCKFGCNLLAASRTIPGSPLTLLTMSSTYLRKTLTPITVRSVSCCFLQVMQYHTVSAISAYLNSDMLPHPKWYQFKKASHSTPSARCVNFF